MRFVSLTEDTKRKYGSISHLIASNNEVRDGNRRDCNDCFRVWFGEVSRMIGPRALLEFHIFGFLEKFRRLTSLHCSVLLKKPQEQ